MKTIFDWLTMPLFQERTAMFIGRREIKTLDNWIHGYWNACDDAGEYERLRTPGGIPIELLRDYIAMKENHLSTGGIPYILQETIKDGDDSLIVDRFFSHVNTFMQLSIRSVQHAEVTPDMKCTFSISQEDMPTGFRKVSLTEGLCWIIWETQAGERYWDCITSSRDCWPFGSYKIGPEENADSFIQRTYRSGFVWEATNQSCYPSRKEQGEGSP